LHIVYPPAPKPEIRPYWDGDEDGLPGVYDSDE
jgi:hypothetical protein